MAAAHYGYLTLKMPAKDGVLTIKGDCKAGMLTLERLYVLSLERKQE
jgi:hypothetical protein